MLDTPGALGLSNYSTSLLVLVFASWGRFQGMLMTRQAYASSPDRPGTNDQYLVPRIIFHFPMLRRASMSWMARDKAMAPYNPVRKSLAATDYGGLYVQPTLPGPKTDSAQPSIMTAFCHAPRSQEHRLSS